MCSRCELPSCAIRPTKLPASFAMAMMAEEQKEGDEEAVLPAPYNDGSSIGRQGRQGGRQAQMTLQESWDEESRRRARVAKMLPCLCCCDEGQYIYCCLPTAPTYILPLCLHMVLCPQQRCNPQIIDGLCGQPGIRKVHGGDGGPTTLKEACKVHCVVNVPLFWVCPCGPCGWCCLQSDNGVTKFGHGWDSPDCIWNPILCWDFKPPCGQSAYQCSVDFPPCCILCVICNNPDIGMQLKSFDPDIIENPGSGCWVPKG